jgi:flavin-binding protein dodecin
VDSVYNVVELIATSNDSWEQATARAVEEAAKTLRDLRVAEVIERDLVIDNGRVLLFRCTVRLSFKHELLDSQ